MRFGLRALGFPLLSAVLLSSAVAQEATQTSELDDTPDVSSSNDTKLQSSLADVMSARMNDAEDLSAVSAAAPSIAVVRPVREAKKTFDWHGAIGQSATFLGIQMAGLVWKQPWMRYELQGKYFKDWMMSIEGLKGWDDGDPYLDNYVGHPLQGAITGYIQVQNDRKGQTAEFGKNRQYWISRLKAMGWMAAYSTQFELGPISEAAIGNTGGYEYAGRTGEMTTGMGYVDLVVTPLGGLGWMIGEDALDKYVIKNLERKGPRWLGNIVRTALNPSRSAANMLRLKKPWYRDLRDNPDAMGFVDSADAGRMTSLDFHPQPRKNEFSVWSAGTFSNGHVFGFAQDRRLYLAALRYARPFAELGGITFKYTAEAYPAAFLTEPYENNQPSLSFNIPTREAIYGAGGSPIGIQFTFRSKKRLQPYISSNGGALYFQKRVLSPTASQFMFTVDMGAGMQFFTSQKKSMLLGYRYFHISNANISHTNPGTDSQFLYVGMSF